MKRTVPGRNDRSKGTGAKAGGFGRNSTFGRKAAEPGAAKTRPKAGLSAKPPKFPPSERDRAKQAAINALKKARRVAARMGVELSEWEDEFLGSVADRIKTYGRAFGDADKGDLAAPMSVMQGRKLKEITKKAKGETRAFKPRKSYRARDPKADD